MKVVINTCYGGYSLSKRGVKRLAALQGRDCYFFTGGLGSPYTPVTEDEGGMFWTAFDTQDIPVEPLPDTWYTQHVLHHSPEDRADPLLIQVIEELGAEANGSCASLRVVEIPNGVVYTIEEYDGREHVAEQHRTWS